MYGLIGGAVGTACYPPGGGRGCSTDGRFRSNICDRVVVMTAGKRGCSSGVIDSMTWDADSNRVSFASSTGGTWQSLGTSKQ